MEEFSINQSKNNNKTGNGMESITIPETRQIKVRRPWKTFRFFAREATSRGPSVKKRIGIACHSISDHFAIDEITSNKA